MHKHGVDLQEKYENPKKCHKTNTKITIKHGTESKNSQKLQTQPLKSFKSSKNLQHANEILQTFKELVEFENEEDEFDEI